MASVTIVIPEESQTTFRDFKLKQKHKYVIFTIDPTTFQLKVEKKGKKRATHEDFLKCLSKKRACYALYDLKYKPYLVCWTPKAATTEDKVFYTSQKGMLIKTFEGVKPVDGRSVKELERALGFEEESDSDDDAWDPDA
eukprot:g1741.t1